MENSNVAYICSDVRSGSTLLDMLMGRHPALTSVGEIHHLHDYLNGTYYREGTSEDTCACEKKISECSFWSLVIAQYNKQFNSDIKILPTRFTVPQNIFSRNVFDFWIATVNLQKLRKERKNNPKFSQHKEVANNRFNLYKIINCVKKSSFVIDSTKKIRDVKFLLAYKPESVKAIFLTRDLRAIATSKSKRQIGSRLSYMMWQTMLFHIKLFLAIKTVPKEKRLVVKYEDLVADPKKTLRSVFLFLGIDASIEIDLQSYCESHILGGSPHRLTNKKLEIFVDDRWKQNTGLFYKFMNKVMAATSKVFNIKAG